MTTEIDLRVGTENDHRDQLFDILEDADAGDEFAVVAGQDINPHLVRYQLDRERVLDWTHADPDAKPRRLQVTVGDSLEQDTLPAIDVRDLKPQRRHESLLALFDELSADERFVLVNDHDPKPLFHELRSMHGDVVDWEYASHGSGEWRVEIGKTADSTAATDGIVTRFDVREIPKEERHPTIHHRFGMIPDGATMELIAPHEPRPLHQEFQQQYGDSFAWEVVESDQGRCRVHITKGEHTDERDDATHSEDERDDATHSEDERDDATHSEDERDDATHSEDGRDDASDSDDSVAASPSNAADVAASPSDDERLEVTDELDVRDLPPAQRHERIFDAYDTLAGGEGFVLVNDHDPKPLYHQFEAEAGPEFRWAYRQREHGDFKVLIGKAETVPADAAGEETAPF